MQEFLIGGGKSHNGGHFLHNSANPRCKAAHQGWCGMGHHPYGAFPVILPKIGSTFVLQLEHCMSFTPKLRVLFQKWGHLAPIGEAMALLAYPPGSASAQYMHLHHTIKLNIKFMTFCTPPIWFRLKLGLHKQTTMFYQLTLQTRVQ